VDRKGVVRFNGVPPADGRTLVALVRKLREER
jgi:hypothetical protein